MCGIFGTVVPSRHALDENTFAALTDRLRHRGPDASGYWLQRVNGGAWQVGLGHRRLSIIDLSPGGAQPMRDDAGRILTFNGEIYNYIELREELARHQQSFRSDSDTEVLLRALAVFGVGALQKLRGMFAFSMWDPTREELLLVRDPFGKKPLYMAELAGGGLVFGSELDAVAAFPGLDRSFDWESLPEYLLYRYVPGPNTFFKSIKKLPPGHFATWRDGRLVTSRYYTPPYAEDVGVAETGDIDQASGVFLEALREAVGLRLRSDAPFGAFLSGGIDSATIVALMSEQLANPVETFSIGFHEGEFSELPYARLVAKRFKTNHEEMLIPSEAVIENLPEASRHRGAPVSEPADIPILLLSKRASTRVKMVLTGEGSDELLGGYPKHKFERWVSRYQRVLPERLHRLIAPPLLKALPYAARRAAIALMAIGERDVATRATVWFGAAAPSDLKLLLGGREPSRPVDPFPFSSRNASPLKRMLFFDQTSWLPDNLLERGDRMMMAAGLEGRMPFMDTELSNVVARFPDRFLVGGAGGKVVLRRAMQDKLPSEILSRRKVGFRVPIHIWLRTTLQGYLRDHLLGPRSLSSGFYDRNVLSRIVDEHTEGRRNHEKLLWTLLNLEIFVRELKPSIA